MEHKNLNQDRQPPSENHKFTPTFFGILLVMAGFLILLDQYLQTEWLSLTVIPATGLILIANGLNNRQMGWIIPGVLVGALGIAVVILFGNILGNMPFLVRLGWSFISFSTGFLTILFFSLLYGNRHAWWSFLVASAIAGLAYPFITGHMSVFVFFASILTMIGFAFLAWGFFERIFGLLIPGSLLSGLGPGFYLGFVSNAGNNELVQVGFFITCIGLGWILITLSSRLLNPVFVWWPLIPGGILTMVGWGLTIGGNRGSAMTLIGNTGSISLIIFGLYLILMRRGIRK
ncbi:MAG: hypothetical protein GX577_12050 [Leptolinea sp.]|nr:hypothetical protein [Leptolinea sp.]